jgi:DNA (cytosine-5)-methyltransferase 1
MTAYYNEFDPYAAQWLRNLIDAGHIAPGVVDSRSIKDVRADELLEYTQCHFFAGIGVWSHALRRAGWSDDRPVWTGSCPCQPFSAAGQQKGFDDERHLWPTWFNLIRECKPAIVLGEQVASALDWLDLVSTDLEGAGYAFGASDLCAAGFGGAHIRQRLYFVGLADTNGRQSRQAGAIQSGREYGQQQEDGGTGGLDYSASARHIGEIGRPEGNSRDEAWLCMSGQGRGLGRLADTDQQGSGRWGILGPGEGAGAGEGATLERSAGLCEDRAATAPMLGRNPADWLYCRDGKWRPVEPGTFPLADAAPARVGRLRAYGNGLDAETACQFISAVMECRP